MKRKTKVFLFSGYASLLLLCLLLFSCKKERNKRYSYWKVDGREYSTNNSEVTIGKAIGVLSSRGTERFDITFYGAFFTEGSLPDNGSFLLVSDNLAQKADQVLLYVYFGTTAYGPSGHETKYLKAERINGKVRYTLPQMWYVNYYDPKDSVFVEGTFNEP